MLRAPYLPTDDRDAARKSIRTVKGSVVYARKKHEIKAMDVLRMAQRLGIPTTDDECEALWALLRVALDQTETLMPMDTAFMVRVETQKQVWEAMRIYVGTHPQCFTVGDVITGAATPPARTWWERWFPGFVNPLKP